MGKKREAIRLGELSDDAKRLSPTQFVASHGGSFLLFMPIEDEHFNHNGLHETRHAGPTNSAKAASDVSSFLVYPLIAGGDQRVIVGRHATCDVIIADDRVSAVHGCFHRDGDQWIAYDAGSTNGTWVNEIDAPAMGTVHGIPMKPMARIRLGGFEATFIEAAQVQAMAKFA